MFWWLCITQRVIKSHELFLVELGLALEGKSLDDQWFGNAGTFEPESPRILAFDSAFFFQHISQQPRVGEALIGGQFQIFVPVGQQSAQVEIF